MALNQLLVQIDGVDEPPAMRKFWTSRFNTLLDASYVVPRKLGKRSLRLRPPKPRPEQIYFIGATNVPIDRLDPALIRPGRMGRLHLVPYAHQGRSQGHLRPLHGEGRARP